MKPAGRAPLRRKDLWVLGALAAVVLLPWMRAVSGNAFPWFMDTLTHFYPYRRMVGVLLARGDAPFWNPSMFGGVPLLANPQIGVLYPGHWPFFLLPSGAMFTLTAAVHVLLGAVGLYGVLRWLRCGRMSAFFGAVAMAWSGWTWAHFAFGSFHQAWAWWPWQWWLILAWTGRAGAGWRGAGVWLGLLTALQILAGALQLVFYNALGCGLLLVAGWAGGPAPRARSLPRLAAGVGALLALSLGWTLAQTLPTSAYFKECIRSQALPLEEIRGGALDAAGLARAFLGGTGLPEDAESTVFLGPVWLALGAIGLIFTPRRREGVALGLVALLGLLLAWRALAGLWSVVLPGFLHMHDPRRALALSATAIPALAALGLEALMIGQSAPRSAVLLRRWVSFAVLAAAIALVGRFALGAESASPSVQDGFVFPALGWLGPWAFWKETTALASTLAVVAIAAGFAIVLPLRRAGPDSSASPAAPARSASRGATLAAGLVGLWGALVLLLFGVNRIDLKVASVGGKDGMLDQVGAVREALAKGLPPTDAPAAPPIRVFAFDPTGHYSYDYARPDAGRWMLPNVAGLTWSADPKDPPGLCDLQGYDPALPRRMAALMDLVNEGHIQLYPRHFTLVRAPRSPMVRLLAPDAAVGPVGRYALPLLPPRLDPGGEKIAPIEEAGAFTRLRIQAGPVGSGDEQLDAFLLDSNGRVLHRLSFAIPSSGTNGAGFAELARPIPPLADRPAAVAFQRGKSPGAGPMRLLAALEQDVLPQGLTLLDPLASGSAPAGSASGSLPPPLDSPALWRIGVASPYIQLFATVFFVPPGEEPRAIARRLARNPGIPVLEWPADEPQPSPPAARDPAAPSAGGSAQLSSWRPGCIQARAEVTAPSGAALVIREPWFPGWSVRVNGKERTPIPADLAYQAVWLSPGAHTVEWTYRPVGFGIGGIAAILSTLAAVVLVLPSRKRVLKETSTASGRARCEEEGGS